MSTLDRPRDFCGVVGAIGPHPHLAQIAVRALSALQHRGQQAAGLARVVEGRLVATCGPGLVREVLPLARTRGMRASACLAHTRYSTSGDEGLGNAQPHLCETPWGPIAIAHNGHVTNHTALRERLEDGGERSDTYLIGRLLSRPHLVADGREVTFARRVLGLADEIAGAYSLGFLQDGVVYAFRDPLGMRPLCLGRLESDAGASWLLTSETCALDEVGAKLVRHLAAGELVRLDHQGPVTLGFAPAPDRQAFCVFEYVYLSHRRSTVDGRSMETARRACGAALWRESPCAADLVIGVPDSGCDAAVGYADAGALPFEHAVTNVLGRRTFIEPTTARRARATGSKFSLSGSVDGQRVVVVDDSIVRGHTLRALARLLREGGAAEVHVRVASPAVRHPCFMGVDIASADELVAARHGLSELTALLGVDSVGYISQAGLFDAIGADPDAHCDACFSGRYPASLELDERASGSPSPPSSQAGSIGVARAAGMPLPGTTPKA